MSQGMLTTMTILFSCMITPTMHLIIYIASLWFLLSVTIFVQTTGLGRIKTTLA